MSDQYADLPYDAWMLDLLGPLRAGFRLLNRWLAVPLVDRGLGPRVLPRVLISPNSGSLLVACAPDATSVHAQFDRLVEADAKTGSVAAWFVEARTG